MIKAGTKCRVLADSENNFNPGDIVVVLEDDDVPYCCLFENYIPNKSIGDYTPGLSHPLYEDELEVLYDMTENNIKVTQLTIEEVKKKIYNNDVENVYILLEANGFILCALKYYRLESIIKYMLDGSAFLKIEVVKNDDRTEE